MCETCVLLIGIETGSPHLRISRVECCMKAKETQAHLLHQNSRMKCKNVVNQEAQNLNAL